MFFSHVFQAAIGHKFELSKLLRQEFANSLFLKALGELRLGQCSLESNAFLRSLSRPIDIADPVHIYFKKTFGTAAQPGCASRFAGAAVYI